MIFCETCIFYLFLNLKCHSGHQKWTSKKSCLEIDTTVSKDSRAKKKTIFCAEDDQKHDYLRSNIVENYKKKAILGHPQHRKSFFGFKIFRNGRIDF